MADTLQTVTFPCSVNSVPFYPATSMRRALDAAINFGQAQYINSLLQWQSPLPYENKRLFSDVITLQFKTQANATPAVINPAEFSYTNLAKLYVCNSVSSNNGPVPGTVVDAFTNYLNAEYTGSYYLINESGPSFTGFWGVQQAAYDIYTDPITQVQVPLVTYMWQFTFGNVLDYTLNSGTYFIRFDNIDVDGNITTWYSEPIMVYGIDALATYPNTLEFEAANKINKNDIIIDGWFNNSLSQVVFSTRVEADILEYEPKGIYLGFLQQDWLAQNTYTKSWETWNLNIGSVAQGIPATMFKIMTKFMEMDYILINNQYYTYDVQSGGSEDASSAWKMEKARWKGLFTGTLPVRYKFENQYFIGAPIVLPRIFSAQFDATFD